LNTNTYSPLVSIIVPIYNCAHFLPDALDSILAQQYPNMEIIVVDDGSSDSSAEVAEAYGASVKVIRQKNQGPAAARNRGVRESSGEYLAFLDGDDAWLPGKLLAQMQHFASHEEVGIVYGRFKRWRVNEEGRYPSVKTFITTENNGSIDDKESGWIYHELLLDGVIHIITAVIPRSLYDTLGGFDESMHVGEDYDFWLRASRLVQAHKLSRDVALYRISPNSTTRIPRTINNEQTVLLRAIERYGLASPNGVAISEKQMRARLFNLAFGHGYMHYWHGSPRIALEAFTDAVRYDRKQVKAIVYCFISYLRCKLFHSSDST
jgi:glycosyltransferase involved in cell wall biosynthesis